MLLIGQWRRLAAVGHVAVEQSRHVAGAVGPKDIIGLRVGIAGGPGRKGSLPRRSARVRSPVAAGSGAGGCADEAWLGSDYGGGADRRARQRRRGGDVGVMLSQGGPWDRERDSTPDS